MSYEEETEYTSSCFRCVDPIQNFKIRVVLKSSKARLVLASQFDLELNASTSGDSPVEEEAEADAEDEEYIFSWQEKVFSQTEISKFSNLSNCKTKLHEKYHDEVLKISSSDSHNSKRKLFTYVEDDNYKMRHEQINLIKDGSCYLSILAEKIDNLEVSGMVPKNYKNVSKRKVVDYSPSDESRKNNHLINTSCQRMFIMADLGVREDKEKDKNCDEYILCALLYDSVNKVLKMSPGFSREVDRKPYAVGSSGHYSKNSCFYWLHHASKQISEEDLKNEKKVMSKVLAHQNEQRKLQIGTEFVTQILNRVNVVVMGEIVSAWDFESDRLSVHFVTSLPTGWSSPVPVSLTGTTQTARTNKFGIGHFCSLFAMDLNFANEGDSAYQPEIYFEVLSIDRWKIYRNEGYAFVSLPRKPGIYTLKLTCWRACDNSVKSRLERFFVGGSRVLENVSYVGTGEKNEERRIMSRFGFETVPTGKLEVRLNVMHQCEVNSEKVEFGSRLSGEVDTSALLGSVEAVLAAFRLARERMLRAKESLQAS